MKTSFYCGSMATPGRASELTSPQAIKGDVTAARDEQEKSKTPVPATVCPRSVRSYLQTRVPVALESLTEGSKESPLPDRAPAWAPSAAPAPHVPQTRSMASLRYMSSSTTSPAYPLPAWHAGGNQVGLVMQHVSEECRCQSSRPGDPGKPYALRPKPGDRRPLYSLQSGKPYALRPKPGDRRPLHSLQSRRLRTVVWRGQEGA